MTGPFPEDDFDEDDPEDGEGSDESPLGKGPAAIAATEQPVDLHAIILADERTPEGLVCLGVFRGDRVVGRTAIAPEMWEEVQRRGIFSEPRPVVLVAREAPPGLQCQLFVLVPAGLLRADDDDEPWSASVPGSGYEAAAGDDDANDRVAFPIGNIVRFAKDRVHVEDLALEAVDVLRKVIAGETVEVVDKALEDLLGGA